MFLSSKTAESMTAIPALTQTLLSLRYKITIYNQLYNHTNEHKFLR